MAFKKPSSDLLIEEELDDEIEAGEEGLQELLEDDKLAKKELKPGQKAVVVRRRIEEYLERQWLNDHYGIELNEAEVEEDFAE